MKIDYNHKDVEKKWQQKWAENKVYSTPDEASNKENKYVLVEFPYPSGNLHVGHWYAFSVTDVYAKYQRMLGKNVLFPIGFDAFGLPAENAAIKRNLNPRDWTLSNIDFMKGQLKSMGASFDWSREVVTCSPEYYKWTQWLFIKLFEKGLAYQADTNVNWCPSCKTVLANEQVISGRCERCDSEVLQKKMKQWMLKITDYADKLTDDLESLDWPEPIKDSQRNWIGRSEGSRIEFSIDGRSEKIKVFTTRADTLFGVTYVVLAPEHELVSVLSENASNKNDIAEYVLKASKKTEMDRMADAGEKTGVKIEGVYAINPANSEKIPVYIADYVLAHYGTGAVMAVPAHDERDWDFAKKFNLPIKQVVVPVFVDYTDQCKPKSDEPFVQRNSVICIVKHHSDDKFICLRWKKVDWATPITGGIEDGESLEETGRREILEETGFTNLKFLGQGFDVVGRYFNNLKNVNRDEKQTPIFFELVDDVAEDVSEEEKEKHDIVWVSKNDVESFLNFDSKIYDARVSVFAWNQYFKPTPYTGSGILINSGKFDYTQSESASKQITDFVGGEMAKTYKLRDWLISRQRYWGCPIPVIHCEKCGPVSAPLESLPVELPEVDDYLPHGEGKSPLAKASGWVKVTCPKCGGIAERETDTLDTFIDSSWYFLRYLDAKNEAEFASAEKISKWMPVDFYSGGAEHTTMHLLYSRFFVKAMKDIGLVDFNEPFTHRLNRGLILGPDGNKMSKSKGNVIDPDEIVERLGADSVRAYLAFIGPYNEVGYFPWDPNGIVGVRRFIERVIRVAEKSFNDNLESDPEIVVELHKTIKKVSEDYEKLKFNTAIAQMMIFINLADKKNVGVEDFKTFLKLFCPVAPHVAEEIWEGVGGEGFLIDQKWPEYDENQLKTSRQKVMIQVNGKVRSDIEISEEMSEDDVIKMTLNNDGVKKWIEGREVVKTIYIKGKIVNIVIK